MAKAIRGEDASPQILEELSSTPYACSSLEQLFGGTANYTFKGTLARPLPDGTTTVMIKHSKPYSASSNDFQLDIGRSFTEEKCLELTSTLPAVESKSARVRTPKLYHFNPETNTQVQEYLENAIDLKRWALAHHSPEFREHEAHFHGVGETIGIWLRRLHAWGMQPEQAELREQVKKNVSMQSLKNLINYTYLVMAVKRYPDILTEAKDIFEQVKALSEAELKDESKLVVIHGDFWTGNTLLPDVPFQKGVRTPVFVVDWEMCEFGVRELDLGQFVAELYNLVFFKNMDAIKWLINGFAAGYGYIDDEFAYRIAIHTGAHLIVISSQVQGWGTEEQVLGVVRRGKELIEHAWHKDRSWFEASDLAGLFRVEGASA